MTYAKTTTVSVERSKAEIERILARYGARQFVHGWDQENAVVAFVVETEGSRRQVRFKLPLPSREDRGITHHSRGRRTDTEIERRFEQMQRSAWRALVLIIKAKLEAIESGIASFEDEFLAYTMLPSGETVGEWIEPQLDEAYTHGLMPGLLALPSGRSEGQDA